MFVSELQRMSLALGSDRDASMDRIKRRMMVGWFEDRGRLLETSVAESMMWDQLSTRSITEKRDFVRQFLHMLLPTIYTTQSDVVESCAFAHVLHAFRNGVNMRIGFTGTLQHVVLPLGEDDRNQTLRNTASEVLGAQVHAVVSGPRTTVHQVRRDRLVQEIVAHMSAYKYDALIDAGGLLTTTSTPHLALMMCEHLGRTIVYVDDNQNKMQLAPGSLVPMPFIDDGTFQVDRHILLYPQRATVGVDIKFPPHESVTGLVTVHQNTRFDELVQAIFRLRHINLLHSVDFVTTNTYTGGHTRVDVLRSAWQNSMRYTALGTMRYLMQQDIEELVRDHLVLRNMSKVELDVFAYVRTYENVRMFPLLARWDNPWMVALKLSTDMPETCLEHIHAAWDSHTNNNDARDMSATVPYIIPEQRQLQKQTQRNIQTHRQTQRIMVKFNSCIGLDSPCRTLPIRLLQGTAPTRFMNIMHTWGIELRGVYILSYLPDNYMGAVPNQQMDTMRYTKHIESTLTKALENSGAWYYRSRGHLVVYGPNKPTDDLGAIADDGHPLVLLLSGRRMGLHERMVFVSFYYAHRWLSMSDIMWVLQCLYIARGGVMDTNNWVEILVSCTFASEHAWRVAAHRAPSTYFPSDERDDVVAMLSSVYYEKPMETAVDVVEKMASLRWSSC
jgi:hypothetical protein